MIKPLTLYLGDRKPAALSPWKESLGKIAAARFLLAAKVEMKAV